MRKILFSLMAVLLSTLVAKADLPFRNHRYDGFKVNVVTPSHTVFLGNSITNMHEWCEAFGSHNILNRGVSGAVTDEMLENFEAVIAGKPAKIFFMMGTNDLGTAGMNTPARVAQRVRLMLKRCKNESPETKVFVQSILPSSRRDLALQRTTNDSIRKICGELNATYIDLWDDLISLSQNSDHTLDALHLSASGYRIWCKKIAQYVGENCTYPDDAANNYGGLGASHGMRVSYFAMSKVAAEDILLIGDETIHGGEWHELLGLANVKNRGNSWGYPGPGISYVKAALQPTLKGRSDNEEPAQVFLSAGSAEAFGSNDIDAIATEYRAMVDELRSLAPNTKIYLQSVLPSSNATTNTSRIVPINARIKSIAEAMDNVTYVDTYTPLVLNGTANPRYFTGNYLYGRGYAKLAQELAKHIPAATPITDMEADARIALFDARTALANALSRVELLNIGTAVGQYSAENIAPVRAKLEESYALLADAGTTVTQFTAKAEEITSLLAKVTMNMPTASEGENITWYNLYTPLRGDRYTTSNGAGQRMTGELKRLTATNMWKFELRQDGSYNIINRADGTYMNPVANFNSAVSTVAAAPAKGWELSYGATDGLFIIRSGSVQLNQTQSGQNFALYNWSSGQDGLDRTDSGCQFAIVEAEELQDNTDPDMPFITTTIGEDGQFATDTRWYTLQITASGLYVSDNAGASSIALSKASTELADADLWCFVGNATTGYQLFNKAAGPTKALAAPATLSTSDNGGSSYPVLRALTAMGNFRSFWRFVVAPNLADDKPAFYIHLDGNTAAKLNNRGGKLAFWTTGVDAGSAFQVKFGQQKMRIDMTTGTFATTGTFSAQWNSTSTDPTQLGLNSGRNNMARQGDNLAAYVGMFSPQTYTLSVGQDFTIGAYTFDFVKLNATDPSFNIIAGDQNLTTQSTTQTFSVNGLSERTATFVLSGQNKGVALSNFWVTVQRALIAPEPQFNVFETKSGQTPYRIPAIAKAQNGDLIAVADYRHTGADIGLVANGRLDLHARISKDNGQTWSNKFSVINGLGGDNGFWTAFGDPCIVADRESSHVLILSCAGNVSFPSGTRQNHQGIAYFLSKDNGTNWTRPIDLEEQFYSVLDNSSRGPVRAMFIGSGKIHQSRYTKVGEYYRLYCSTLVKDVNGTHCNYVYYSDDFGRNWNLLGSADIPAIPSGADEPKVEELPDGSIICSSRVTGGRYFNIFSFTNAEEGKGYWGTTAFSGEGNKGTTAVGNSTNGEIFILPATRKRDGKDVFVALQSVPLGSGRANVGIYYKELASFADYATPAAFAANWNGRHQASYLGSAYSTMTLQKDNTIGFLFEEETFGAGYTIVYKNYSLEYITDSLFTFNAALDNAPILAEAAQTRVTSITNNAGDFVGMFNKEKVADLEAALAQFNAAPTVTAYEGLNAFVANNTIALEMDQCYTFLNRLYPTLYLTPRTSDNAFTGVAARTDSQKFLIVDKGNGTFALYHPTTKKWLGPTLPIYQYIQMVDEAQAGVYKLVASLDGNSALQCVAPGNASYPAIHLSGQNNLVSWTVGAEASHWKIAITTAPTSINTLLAPEAATDGAIYDLQGRRVKNATRGGVYIVGGKKVIF